MSVLFYGILNAKPVVELKQEIGKERTKMPPSQTARCRIWWDKDIEAYHIQCPHNESFIEAIKQKIPAGHRSFDPATKFWVFTEQFFGPVSKLAQAIWPSPGDVQIMTRQQVESASQSSATVKKNQPIATSCEAFMKLVGQDAMAAAYKKAAMMLHPDRGGDIGKMQELNVLWSQIQKELFS